MHILRVNSTQSTIFCSSSENGSIISTISVRNISLRLVPFVKMNAVSVILLMSMIYLATAESDQCGGCAPGSSCKVFFTAFILHQTFKYRKCVDDNETIEPQELLKPSQNDASETFRRFILRSCSSETVAVDCGKERCCLGDQFCSPLLPKYVPCNLKNSHKCDCLEGLVCRKTYSLKIPYIGITLDLKQCMEPEDDAEVKEVEMTEN